MNEVDSIFLLGVVILLKFNYEQCKYFVNKLKVVVYSVYFFFELIGEFLIVMEVFNLREVEVEVVKEKSYIDKLRLYGELNVFI